MGDAGEGSAEDHPIRVVIADDSEDIRTLIRMQLERDGRFQVLAEAVGAEEAVELLRQHRPEVATFDLHMPGMQDLEGVREARAASPDTALFIVTGTYHPGRDPDLDLADVAGWLTKDEIMSGLPDRVAEIARPNPGLGER